MVRIGGSRRARWQRERGRALAKGHLEGFRIYATHRYTLSKTKPTPQANILRIYSRSTAALVRSDVEQKNMRGYSNKRCAEEPYYFYWWCSRILLERVTRFCAAASKVLYKENRPVKMIFSQRGGMSYPRLMSYLGLL